MADELSQRADSVPSLSRSVHAIALHDSVALARVLKATWVGGNDGHGTNLSDSNLSSVVPLSPDMTTILHQWTGPAIGLSQEGIQGSPGSRPAAAVCAVGCGRR